MIHTCEDFCSLPVHYLLQFPDISVLAYWYIEPEQFDKPLVVIIEDMECCDGETLAEFISILG